MISQETGRETDNMFYGLHISSKCLLKFLVTTATLDVNRFNCIHLSIYFHLYPYIWSCYLTHDARVTCDTSGLRHVSAKTSVGF